MKIFDRVLNPREIRRRLGLNQEQFWTQIGVTQSGGSRYESGREMPKPVRELLRLVHVEQVDLSQVKRVDFEIISYLKSSHPDLYRTLRRAVKGRQPGVRYRGRSCRSRAGGGRRFHRPAAASRRTSRRHAFLLTLALPAHRTRYGGFVFRVPESRRRAESLPKRGKIALPNVALAQRNTGRLPRGFSANEFRTAGNSVRPSADGEMSTRSAARTHRWAK